MGAFYNTHCQAYDQALVACRETRDWAPVTVKLDRLDLRLKALGMTRRRASVAAGLSPGYVQNIVNNPEQQRMPREIAKLARALECSVAYLEGRSDDPGLEDFGTPLAITLPIRAKIGAGFWVEVEHAPAALGEFVVEPLPAYRHARQWLDVVEGDSMDRRYPAGSLVRVASAEDIGYSPRAGDNVLLQRQRGDLIEWSVKELAIDARGRLQAWPRSHNPRWSEPIEFGDPEHNHVSILGVVVRGYILP